MADNLAEEIRINLTENNIITRSAVEIMLSGDNVVVGGEFRQNELLNFEQNPHRIIKSYIKDSVFRFFSNSKNRRPSIIHI